MALGSITIDLLLKTGAFNNDAKLAERRMKSLGEEAKRAGTIIGSALAIGGTAIFYKFMQATKAAAAEQAQLTAVLTSTGHAAGFSQDRLNDMSDALARNTTHSAGEITEAQTRLLSYSNIVGEVFPEALQMAIDQSARLGENINQSAETIGRALQNPAKAMQALGRQGFEMSKSQQELLQRLQDTGRVAEAQRMILEMMAESYAGAGEAARNTLGGALGEVSKAVDDLLTGETGSEGVRGLTEAVLQFAQTLRDPAVTEGFNTMLQGMAKLASGAVKALTEIANLTRFVAEEIASRVHGPALDDIVRIEQALDRQQALVDQLDQKGTGAERRNTSKYAAEQRAELDRLKERLALARQFAEQTAARTPAKGPDPFAPDLKYDLPEALTSSTAKKLSDATRLRAAAERDAAKAMRDSEAALREYMAAQIEAESITLDWSRRIEDMAARMEGPASVAVLTLKRSVAELDAAMAAGYITAVQHGQGVAALSTDYYQALQAANDTKDAMTVFAEQAARNIQSFLGDSLFNVLDGNFKSIADSFSDMIKRMLAEAAAAKILEAFSAWAGAYTGAGSGFVNALGGSLSGRRATGGPVYPGGTFLVGENGPEVLRMGNNSGTIVPNNRLSSLGGGASPVRVEVINNGQPMQANASQQTMPDGTQLVRIVLNAVAESIGSGSGPINPALKGRFGLREAV